MAWERTRSEALAEVFWNQPLGEGVYVPRMSDAVPKSCRVSQTGSCTQLSQQCRQWDGELWMQVGSSAGMM